MEYKGEKKRLLIIESLVDNKLVIIYLEGSCLIILHNPGFLLHYITM